MPDCQMCWNDWPSLQVTAFPAVDPEVQVCRNCVRDQKHVIAFIRSKGFELATISLETGEIESRFAPQAGLKTLDSSPASVVKPETEEEPPSPPAKKPVKGA